MVHSPPSCCFGLSIQDRLAVNHEVVRDVLRKAFGTSCCNPSDGVLAGAQWLHKKVIALLGARAQDKLGNHTGIICEQVAGRQLHIEKRRQASRRSGEETLRLRHAEFIDPHRDLRRNCAGSMRTYIRFSPSLRRITQEG